jgi:hypothetical protein
MHGWQTPLIKGTAIDAAREMAKPIREVYEHFDEYSRGPGDYRAGVRTVLDQLAPLIYTTEELT